MTMRHGCRLLGIGLVLVLLVACGSEASDADPPRQGIASGDAHGDSGTEPYEGLWKLVEGSGPEGDVPVVKGWDVTGHIDETSIYGDTGCNYYLQPIKVVGNALSFGDGGYLDEAGCRPPAPEDAYLAALHGATEITRDDDRLVLSGPDARLVFESVPPPPIEQMVDRRWRLRKVFRTYPRTGVVMVDGEFLLHQGGGYVASAGCMRERGKWIVSGDRVTFTESSSRGRCTQDELNRYAISAGDTLGEGFTARVRGNQLTIFATRSRGRLIYRAAEQRAPRSTTS